MTIVEAENRARELWGPTGMVMLRKAGRYPGNDGKPGERMETCLVGVRGALPGMIVRGRGFSWKQAFEDARARGYGGALDLEET